MCRFADCARVAIEFTNHLTPVAMIYRFDIERLYSEMLTHFANLIRIDTTNPPGNELEAVRYLSAVFAREKIGYEIVEPQPGRASIVARLKGDGSRRPLLLMSHLDVVGVEAKKWDLPPFSGKIQDGFLWGRGALDCKNTVVLWLMVMIAIKRSGWIPSRDLLFLAAADEETGGRWGARWIVENRFDLVDAEAALNEGGGFGFEFSGQRFYTYQTAEKGNLWLKITRHGTPGHASVPHMDNPVGQLNELIYRLQRLRMSFSVCQTVRVMVQAMAKSQPFPLSLAMKQILNPLFSDLILSKAIKNSSIAATLRALLRNTLCPTVLRAGQKVNVIPSEAFAEIDIRVLPGIEMDAVLKRITAAIGSSFEIEVTDLVKPSESVLKHHLADCICSSMQKRIPGSPVIPLMSPGSSDSGFFRETGMVVYGFTPLLAKDDISVIHGHNEKISLESIRFSLEVGLDTVYQYIA